MNKAIFIFLLFSFQITAFAQLAWKPITPQTKPWSRWWWQGNAVNQKDLTFNLEAYQKVGLGGLEITPIYGVKGYESQFIDFLSPQWIEMFKHTLDESKRLGLGIDLANASGWPFGGRWVQPEDACRYVAHRVFTLKEGEKMNEPIVFQQKPLLRFVLPKNIDISTLQQPIAKNNNLQELAIDQVRFEKSLPLNTFMAYSDAGEILNLTDKVKDGILDWQAPKGSWKLYAIFEGWHGKMVERAGPGGEGDVIDHFSEKALKNYLGAFDKSLEKTDLSNLRAFFNDSYEVDDARGQADWTPELFNEFQKRRGYDLRNYLPYLFSQSKTDTNRRVLCDYRETISDLIYEKYTSVWAKWAADKGKIVRNQAHGSPGNTLDLYSVVDIPEIEGTDLLRIKFASSASNVMGKKLISSETATWENEHFLSNLGDVKKAIDRFFLGGVNHIFYHGTNYSPQNEAFPGWLFYAAVHFTPQNPFWKHFGSLNTYVARTQGFLQDSKPDNDILLYFPIYDRFSEHSPKGLLQHFDGVTPEFNNTDFKTIAQTMLDKGYSFDYISDKQIKNLSVENQQIKTNGANYKTILVSDNETIPFETFEKLVALAKEGATIIFHQKLPTTISGFSNFLNKEENLKALTNGLIFSENKTLNVKEAIVEKGKIIVGESLESIMSAASVQRETMLDKGLKCIRKKYAKGTYYFVNNDSEKDFDGWVSLQTSFQSVALYNPMTGTLGMAKYDTKNQAVYLQIMAGESIIVQTNDELEKGANYPYFQTKGTAQTLVGNWKLTFTEGGEILPKSVETTHLDSWTNITGEDYQNFSGTAVYTHQFKNPNASKTGYWLDFGKIAESAKVSVNGVELGTLLGPTYRIFVPAKLLKSRNTLSVEVVNSMANQVIALEKKGIIWQKFYNINVSARLKENLGKEGYFSTKNWQARPSGLLGEVKIWAVEPK
jgi:alpha-L-rhamnosidase